MTGHIGIYGRTFVKELLPAWKDTAPLLLTQSLSCCTPKKGKGGLRRTGPAKLSSATGTTESPLEFPLEEICFWNRFATLQQSSK